MEINKDEIAKIRNELSKEYEASSKATTINMLLLVVFLMFPIAGSLKILNDPGDASMVDIVLPTIIALIATSMVRYFYVVPRTKKYKDSVKKVINSLVFEKMFENVSFTPETGISRTELKTIELIPFGNRYSSNDLLKGRKDGVDFSRADVWTYTERTDSDGNTTTNTDFKGQVYKFDFHKDTINYVQIKDKKFLSGIFKGHKLQNVHKITFEDERFNERFDVYTNDEEEAFYVFTPHFMEKMMNLKEKFHSRLSVVVTKGVIYIAANTGGDAFEIKNNQEVTDAFIQDVISEANIISELITDLDLDSDLFKQRN